MEGYLMNQSDSPPEEPLTEATFLILLSLASEPKHGYGIMKDVRALSEDRIVLGTGTLYGALKRLLEQGWIRRVDEPENGASGRERKFYELTRSGQRVLDAEAVRLQRLVSAARVRMVGGCV
jgi:DNA-binding PadR family transcriptional regulator